MHIDNMHIALINYIISRQRGEQFVVRIEDTDKKDDVARKDQEMLELLKKFALEQDQLFYQSDNLSRHQQFALSLLEQKKAFACICTEEELQENRQRAKLNKEVYQYSGKCLKNQENISLQIKDSETPFIIRIKKPQNPIVFIDKIKGEISTEPNEIDNFVILEADGVPTQTFAIACDDMLMDISIIIRNVDYANNTPKQIHIKNSLGYTAQTKYVHLPTILNESSKKDDTYSIKWLLEQGFLPDTIINYLIFISDETPKEIFRLPDAIDWFSLNNIYKSPAKFDIDKLRSINRKHLGLMEDIALSKIFGFADADIGKLLKIYLGELSTINELDGKIQAIFATKALDKEWSDEMKTISKHIQEAPMIDLFDEFKSYISLKSGFKGENFLIPLHLLMTGANNGPELSDIYPLLKPYITEVTRIKT